MMATSRVVLAAAVALCASPAHAWWRDAPPRDRGDVPYPYPEDRRYDTKTWKDGIDETKINVHLVPHTHDDTGWQVTVDQYFFDEVYYVVDTVVDQLLKDPSRHFIYVEVGFFARWWDEQPDERRNATKQLVANGQLEFINGAWCMHDEASPYYVEMMDQTTRGHQFLLKNFGPNAAPRGTWQIDPFGHSNTEAWLFGAESGMHSLYWGRTDYQDMHMRTSWEGHENNQWPQWVWQASQSLGSSATVLAGQLGTGGYGTHIAWDNDGGAVQDDPRRHDYNADEMVDAFINYAIQQQNYTKTNHQMWACGSDFQYQDADHWFHNLDKIMHYVNLNASRGGPVQAFYSSPTHYTDAVYNVTKTQNLKWEVRFDDVFPLANNPHEYWSGYFTSRPSLKRQVRYASNFLNAARQMEVLAGVTAADVNTPTTRPSPAVGTSWTDSFEGTIGVATHHDGMSGTERQSVSDDYSQRISESHFEVEAGVALALQKLSGHTDPLGHCNCNAEGNCLNMSVCAYTTGPDEFSVFAWNSQMRTLTSYQRIPVQGASWTVTDVASGQEIPSQTIPLDNRTLQLPLLYLNKYKMNASTVAAAEAQLANKATHVLMFQVNLPAVGYNVYNAKAGASALSSQTKGPEQPTTVSNGVYELTLNYDTGLVESIKNLASGATTTLAINWGFYNSSTGGCTYLANGTSLGCDGQASGAYIFRPINQSAWPVVSSGTPTLEVSQGPIVTEIKQTFSEYASHVIRLTNGSNFVEVEWTAGPIPIGRPAPPPLPAPGGCVGWFQTQNCDSHGPPDPTHNKDCNATLSKNGESGYCLCAHKVKVYGDGCGGPDGVKNCNEACARPVPQPMPLEGKEVVMQFTSGLDSGAKFYTDSNGREMIPRVRNARGPNYPPLQVNEPVAGNYYPVNSLISIDDGKTEMAVVTDVSMGGTSLQSGQLEVMVHRRVQADDHRGVQEPLNETMCGCNDIGAAPGAMGAHGHEGDGGCDCQGLTMRGSMYLVIDSVENSHATRRALVESLNFPPVLAFSTSTAGVKVPSYSAVAAALPANIKLLTVTNNYASVHNGQVLLRLGHLYQVDEHPQLSQPATVNLSQVFSKAGLKVTAATEMSLTANQLRTDADAKAYDWPVEDVTGGLTPKSDNAFEARVPFDADGLNVTIRPMEVRTFIVTLA